MRQKLNGIVLNVIKYNERHNIAHVYTDLNGVMGFVVPVARSAASRVRNSMLMPLSLIGFESVVKPGRDLGVMYDLHRTFPVSSIYSDPVKNAEAMMVCEVLSHCIVERERNDLLFRFISGSVQVLEQSRQGYANFHICFLYHLGVFLGIEPDMATYEDGYWFDMVGGVFTASRPGGNDCLAPADAAVLHLLSRIRYSNMHLFRFNHHQRNRMLDLIITYYKIHNSTIGTLKSPQVLKQLFV